MGQHGQKKYKKKGEQVRGVILVSLKNASFLMVYTINWFEKCSILITVLTLATDLQLSPQGVGGGWAYHCTVFLFCHIPMLFPSVI
jgi:hypothetical protein